MDSIFIKNNRQDLQDHQDFFYSRFPEETGNTPSASRNSCPAIGKLIDKQLGIDKGFSVLGRGNNSFPPVGG